jgi:hypothetical protein
VALGFISLTEHPMVVALSVDADDVKVYASNVRTMIAKFMLLLAVLIMPLGMTAAPAAPHHSMAAGMPMKDCPEQPPKHDRKGAVAECTMACSSALPATELVSDAPMLVHSAPVLPAIALALEGLHPDTATPPPKQS